MPAEFARWQHRSRPCGDVPDQADPGSDRQGRLQTQFRTEMPGRSLAVERESHSNHVEVKLLTMKGAGRVRQMAAQIPPLIRQCVDDGVKAIVLQLCCCFFLNVCTGQMAVKPNELQVGQATDALNELSADAPVRTEPTHPRINFQLHGEWFATSLRADAITEAGFLQAAQRWHQLTLVATGQFIGAVQCAQKKYRGVDASRP